MKFETNFKHKEHHEQQTTTTTSSNTSLNKSNSFCLKSFLEKTKNKVLNNANCSNSSQCCHQHRLQTRTNRSSFKNFNHHNHHHHHKINIIKPIALRPNQTDLLLLKQEKTINCLNDLNNNFRFSSIDSINSLNKSPNICMQRRATVPRVNLKNLSINYVLSTTTTTDNESVQQRPGLNLIKMKLQRFLNENRSSDDLFKLKTFDILSLSALNLNGKNHHHQKQQYTKSMRLNNTQINCYNTNLILNSSSVSSLSSSVNQNNFQMCLSSSSSSNESDLDIAQIENDLNF